MKEDSAPEFANPNPKDKPENMDMTSISDVEPRQPNTAAKPKKPYIKPAFRYEQVFVTTALSCGKLAGTCMNSKVS